MLSKLHELAKNNNERLNWDDYFMSSLQNVVLVQDSTLVLLW